MAAAPPATPSAANSSSAAAAANGEARLKCKKCRQVLITNPPHTFLDSCEGGEEGGNVFSMSDDNIPEWIDTAIEQGGWTKGKLLCPGCGVRVGGFDYVGGVSNPLYIVKSKVDFSSPTSITKLVEPKISDQVSELSLGSGVEEVMENVYRSNSQDISSTGGTSSALLVASASTSAQSQGSGGSEEDEGDLSCGEDTSSSASNHTDHESSDEEIEFRSRRQLEKEIRRKRRKEREKTRLRMRESESQRVEAKVRELLEAEPELEELPDDVICPVCLDLLHEPFQTEPCRHIFCEPCLRRLGQKNPMNTKCPLCRTRIRFCKHIAATSREIRERHEAMYLRRKKFERSTPVYSYPLPWTPGWRNLLRGRPLGGNRLLVEDNHAEYIRTILHQVPYYIPPIMFANIINIAIFGFMIGLVEILPSVLFSLFGSGRAGDTATNLTDIGDITVPEMSGDSIDVPEETDQQTLNLAQDLPGLVEEGMGPDAVDSTFYFILLILSMIAAAVGQLILNQDQAQGGRPGYRLSDIMLVICLSSLPLFIIPTILPYRSSEGAYLGVVTKKLINLITSHFSIHTVLLVVVLACLVYNYDGVDEVLA